MDNYVLSNEEKIYPIFKVNIESKNYLFYSYNDVNFKQNDIYVGEELNDELLPVNDEMLPILEKKYFELIEKI